MVRIEETIHVAGVIDADEAAMLIDSGVRFLGFPLVLGYHQEDLSVDEAAAIVTRYGGDATFFLITYLTEARKIAGLCAMLNVGMVQLHADVSVNCLVTLRKAKPGLHIVKSLIVRGDNADALAGQVAMLAPHVDAFITDTFDPETGASGATGRTHDWTVSRRLVELSPKPVILAGGLTASNVREAIETVGPAGVDVHTGVERDDGRKCPDLTTRFVAEARAGFASIQP